MVRLFRKQTQKNERNWPIVRAEDQISKQKHNKVGKDSWVTSDIIQLGLELNGVQFCLKPFECLLEEQNQQDWDTTSYIKYPRSTVLLCCAHRTSESFETQNMGYPKSVIHHDFLPCLMAKIGAKFPILTHLSELFGPRSASWYASCTPDLVQSSFPPGHGQSRIRLVKCIGI